jgi:RNA polymerase sigma-70 factor, ECF subfamily
MRSRHAGQTGYVPTVRDDAAVVQGLREGDEAVFAEAVDRYGPSMLRVARLHVRSRAVAEEVVQDTWLAVFQGIDRFEERSSFKGWLFRILTNQAKTRGAREGRGVPFSALIATDAAASEPSVDPDRFLDIDDPRWPYHWARPPEAWPEERLLAGETLRVIGETIEALPETQREVITLRDVKGWDADEVVEALEISHANQRVLLHRARSRVRAAIEAYMNPELQP